MTAMEAIPSGYRARGSLPAAYRAADYPVIAVPFRLAVLHPVLAHGIGRERTALHPLARRRRTGPNCAIGTLGTPPGRRAPAVQLGLMLQMAPGRSSPPAPRLSRPSAGNWTAG